MTRTTRIVAYKVNGSIYNTACALEALNKITEFSTVALNEMLNMMDTMCEYEITGLRKVAIVEKTVVVFPVEEGGVIEL